MAAARPPAWGFQHQGSVGSAGLVALADAAVLRFKERGVPLPAGNRVERAREIIRESHDGRRPVTGDDENAALIADAVRDMWDFYLIARTLPGDRAPDLNGKLKVMMRGSNSTTAEEPSTPRDIQFEQLVGARLAMAEIATWPAEPDLRFRLAGGEWGVAAKRVRSEGQIAKRTTEARHQLEEQGLRGVIAVNVDHFVAGLPAGGSADEVGSAVDERIARLGALYPELAKQRSLLGIMVMGHVVKWAFDADPPRLHQAWIFRGGTFLHDDEASSVTHELFGRLEQSKRPRLQEMVREIELLVGRGQ